MNGYKKIDGILYYQGLLFILEIIQTKLISQHYNNFLIENFSINKTKELTSRKYSWPSFQKNIVAYIKGCNICLTLKVVRYKLYKDLQLLLIPTHYWKDFFMDFMTGLLILTNWKRENYNHCWLAHKNDVLWANQSHYQCFRGSWGYCKRSN